MIITAINKPTQLALHAGLGCGMSLAGGNNCASGAASGVVGELSAEFLDKNTGLGKTGVIEGAKIMSALAASAIVGPDDGGSVFAGSQIGRNAAENNYLSPKEKGALVKELKDCGNNSDCQNNVQMKYEKISEPREVELVKAKISCIGYGVGCDIVDNFYNDDRIKLTLEGNSHYNSLSLEEIKNQYVLLPPEKAIYHTYQTDPNTGEVVNILMGAQQGYEKYVHKTMGYEVVVDTATGNIVTDHLNIGTYNYYNSELNGVESNPLINGTKKHITYDVIPYFLLGNSSQDPTNTSERIIRTGYGFINTLTKQK